MSVKKCKECGQQISSEAKQCAHCGKPQSQSGAIIGGIVSLAVVVLIIYSLEKGENPIGVLKGLWSSLEYNLLSANSKEITNNDSEDKEELAKWVKQSVQEEIKKDNAYSGLVVGEVVLIRESANKFTGWVEYKYGTETEKAKLSVTVDGNQKMYLCDPPHALIMKKALQNLGNPFYQ